MKLLNKFAFWLKKPQTNAAPPRTWDMDGFHSMFFSDYARGRISGHIGSPKVRVGDIVVCPMTSGRRHLFEVVEIEYMRDPSDQFFGSVNPLRYEDEPAVNTQEPFGGYEMAPKVLFVREAWGKLADQMKANEVAQVDVAPYYARRPSTSTAFHTGRGSTWGPEAIDKLHAALTALQEAGRD